MEYRDNVDMHIDDANKDEYSSYASDKLAEEQDRLIQRSIAHSLVAIARLLSEETKIGGALNLDRTVRVRQG